MMVFSTDKFITTIRKQLDGIADDFINDMIHDAIIVATRLKEDDDDALTHMNEISNDINVIAPHISWLFEDDNNNIIQNIYNSSFFAPVEGQPV